MVRGQHPRSPTIKAVSPRPLLFIAGQNAHSRYFSEDAYNLAAEPKELVIVPNAGTCRPLRSSRDNSLRQADRVLQSEPRVSGPQSAPHASQISLSCHTRHRDDIQSGTMTASLRTDSYSQGNNIYGFSPRMADGGSSTSSFTGLLPNGRRGFLILWRILEPFDCAEFPDQCSRSPRAARDPVAAGR